VKMMKDEQAFRQAVWNEMQKAVPAMVRKHREEAAKRADIQRRVEGCQAAIEHRRQEYAAQMQQASEASKAAHQKQQADLQTALSSGDPDAFAAALAAFANGRQA